MFWQEKILWILTVWWMGFNYYFGVEISSELAQYYSGKLKILCQKSSMKVHPITISGVQIIWKYINKIKQIIWISHQFTKNVFLIWHETVLDPLKNVCISSSQPCFHFQKCLWTHFRPCLSSIENVFLIKLESSTSNGTTCPVTVNTVNV